MTDYEVGDHVQFADGQGEIRKIEERPNGGQLLHIYTTEGQLHKLPSEELTRLGEEKHVTPEELNLVSAAFVIQDDKAK